MSPTSTTRSAPHANRTRPPHAVYDAAFAYTAGLWLTRDHPELVLVGRWPQAHAILAAVVSVIDEGRRFEPNDTSDQVLEGYPVRFGHVSAHRRKELLTYADWLNSGARSRNFKSCSRTAAATGPMTRDTTPFRSRCSQAQHGERERLAPSGAAHR